MRNGSARALVEDGLRQTEAGVTLTAAVVARFDEINRREGDLAGVVRSIVRHGAEQQRDVGSAAGAIHASAAITQRVEDAAAASAATAEELAAQAAMLQQTVDRFRLRDTRETQAPGQSPGAFRPERRRHVYNPH